MWDFEDKIYDDVGKTYDSDKFKNLLSKKWDKIVTHNPIGEYGHPKHKRIFETVKSLTDKFYVFGKNIVKLPKDILTIKLNLLKEYKSEQEIINQLKSNNGDWFKSNNNKTNYIEHEWLSKYNPKKDITKYVACYDK